MLDMDKESLSEEAQLLLENPILAEAFENVRLKALVALSEVDVEDMAEILRLQAIAHCTLDVIRQLGYHITASGKRDGGFDMSIDEPEESDSVN